MVWLLWACAKDEGTTPPTEDTTTDVTAAPPCPAGDGPQISTSTGCVRGALTASGREQFLGIPYAEPPVGPLRWADTVPVAPWSEPLDATALGSPCVQFSDSTFEDLVAGDGQEDCLTLNIFRPAGAVDLPLLVFVHGGGYLTGTGAAPFLTDDPALAEAAVVVTLNYRLGALGFLAHPALSAEGPEGVSGNYGLQDLLAALAWVDANVEALGGDPSRRILFGESAGSLQTCSALASPRAAGRFDAAIAQSGPCASLVRPLRDPPPLVRSGEQQGEDFAAQVGCEADVAACLRQVPVETVAKVGESGILGQEGEWDWQPWMDGVWMPADSVPEAFLRGDWNQVPVLATVNGDEGTLFTAGQAPTQEALDGFVAAFAFGLGVDATALAAMYDPAAYGDSPQLAYAALFGDVFFVCPTVWQQEVLAQQVPARGGYWLHAPLPFGDLGAFHGSEMPYVMGTGLDAASPEEAALSARIRAAWRTMADGSPGIDGADPWPTVDGGWVHTTLDASAVAGAPRPEACDFFRDSRANPY